MKSLAVRFTALGIMCYFFASGNPAELCITAIDTRKHWPLFAFQIKNSQLRKLNAVQNFFAVCNFFSQREQFRCLINKIRCIDFILWRNSVGEMVAGSNQALQQIKILAYVFS